MNAAGARDGECAAAVVRLARTRRGRPALDALLDWLASPGAGSASPHAPPEPMGNDDADHRAMAGFAAALRRTRARTVFVGRTFESPEAVPVGRLRFRPLDGDPDCGGNEGVFAVGDWGVCLQGLRIRETAPGVWEVGDRWADGFSFALTSDAPFADAVWEVDEHDLPGPVPPLDVDEAALAVFLPHLPALAAALWDTRPVDRPRAEAAIRAHYGAVRSFQGPPDIRWHAGPGAAIAALVADGSDLAGMKKDLRDRALADFEREITVRLDGRGRLLDEGLWRAVTRAVGARVGDALSDLALDRHAHQALCGLGLLADHQRLARLDFLAVNGVALPAPVETFRALTRAAWLLFPGMDVVQAVERPVAVEPAGPGRLALVFSDGDRMEIGMTGEEA